jgi:ribosomal protein S27AE
MTQLQSTAANSNAMIRPPCPKCGTTMMLTRIEPDAPGYDRRTFECPQCENSETVLANFR